MAERYKASIRVISQKGTCTLGYKVGDQWVIEKKTPEGLCLAAFNSLFPRLNVLMFGGAFPWEADPDRTTIACPDAANPVVFELRRLHD
ncbi:TIGR04076 family protein [Chloroflexota bacterium]